MMFLPLRETPRQLPLTDLTFCSYQLTLLLHPFSRYAQLRGSSPVGEPFLKEHPSSYKPP